MLCCRGLDGKTRLGDDRSYSGFELGREGDEPVQLLNVAYFVGGFSGSSVVALRSAVEVVEEGDGAVLAPFRAADGLAADFVEVFEAGAYRWFAGVFAVDEGDV